jgi:hypothetical protein
MSIGSPYRAASEDAGMSTLRVLADIIRGDGGKVKRNTGTVLSATRWLAYCVFHLQIWQACLS